MKGLRAAPIGACALASGVLASSALASSACATATGDVRGGEPLGGDQAPPTFEEPIALCRVPGEESEARPGSRFSELYRDFFGPSAPTSCAGSTIICHANPEQSGARQSRFTCPDDPNACHASFATSGLVTAEDGAAPDQSKLVQTLRREGGTSGAQSMPLSPNCKFSRGSISRIEAWIAAGAPND